MRHIDNSILEDTLQWRFYGHGSTYVVIRSLRFEKTSWNENRWSCLESCKLHKNSSMHLKQRCSKIDHVSLILYVSLFSETNLVFKYNFVLIGTLDNFCHNLFTCLPFAYHLLFPWSWRSSSSSIHFVITNIKTLMRVWCSFVLRRLRKPQSFIMLLFFTKNSYLLTAKIAFDVTKSFWVLHVAQELESSFRDVFRTYLEDHAKIINGC